MTATKPQWIVPFDEGGRDMRELLGGKGANVAEMTRVLGPERVPSGFTITTEACVRLHARRPARSPRASPRRSPRRWRALEERAGKRLGDADDPLLVSVRSGARESMPGMMDTVLNLGLNDESVEGLAARTGNPRFAWDAYRRFVQMFGNVVPRRSPASGFEAGDRRAQGGRAASSWTSSSTRRTCAALVDAFKAIYATDRRGLPAGPAGAAAPGDPRRVRLVAGQARRDLPAHQPHPRRLGHGLQRAADGVRQQGRHVVLGRGVLARRGHRRARAVGRLPRQRAGRGRGLGRAHAARPRRDGRRDARGARRADARSCGRSRRTTGHAGHGVHRRGGRALHAADAQRQAPGAGRGALRRRRRRARACSRARRRSTRSTPPASTRSCTPRSTPTPTFTVLATGVAASPGRGQGADRVHARRRRRLGRSAGAR